MTSGRRTFTRGRLVVVSSLIGGEYGGLGGFGQGIFSIRESGGNAFSCSFLAMVFSSSLIHSSL